jgi:hypothetical protein
VRTILVSSTLLITVIFSLSLGVISAYAAIHGILHAFAHRPRLQEEPVPALLSQEATLQH